MQFALGGWPSTVLVELLRVPGVRASASGPVSEWVSARTSVPPPSSSSSSSGSRTGREWLLTSRRRRPRPRCRPTVETRPRPSLDRPRRGRPGDNGRTPSAGFVSSFSWPIRAERFRSRVPCGLDVGLRAPLLSIGPPRLSLAELRRAGWSWAIHATASASEKVWGAYAEHGRVQLRSNCDARLTIHGIDTPWYV